MAVKYRDILKHHANLIELRAKMRNAYRMAEAADVEWNALNDAFKLKHEREDARRAEQGAFPKSEKNKRDDKTENYELADAFALQGWWRTQAMYYAHLIQAEVAVHATLREEEL